ncbi:hypothetical protein BD324DRAFT_648407 [Kockovaella imperatae]|uniref:RNA helicase n=1 Tax=Kockovaella imperatae TaxID=4999 RepID=A0A1Y1UP04_9TREE|nr:hypothetical protein BD324DRAFT_648407 [Kockovaella imperatae]ORX39780.1 hypothetical protein BD324DRAFT_648407 [Kockovaella imperatae]
MSRRDHDSPREKERDARRSDRDRSPAKSSPAPVTPNPGGQSPAPNGEDAKPKTAKERLEAWKRQRELKNKTDSSTPEPAAAAAAAEKKHSFSATPSASGTASLPPKPTGFSRVGLSRIGLPMKPGSAPLKKSALAFDDEVSTDRKLEKLDLPEVNPEVQSGEAAQLEVIGGDMAAEEVEADIKPSVENGDSDAMDVDKKPEAADEEDEEDPLDAFMKANTEQVKQVNTSDARRLGLLGDGEESEDEAEIKNKQEEELEKAEAILQLAATKSRKKDLPKPDHSKIDYEPFRKSFYVPPVESFDMSEEEVELMRLEMDGIKIRGKDAPRPVRNWGAFGLPTSCLDLIEKKEWAAPTSIQAQTIPAIMSGRDVIGIAKTGSGKTIAFLLPLFRHVKDQRPVGSNEGPIAVVMSPTRELAMQTYREAKSFLNVLNVRASCCVGGQSISEDIASMKKGSEVVFCTPGRMIDLLTANNGRVTNLRRCTYIVLDEADRMFDMGFEPQVMKIIDNVRPSAQKVLLSATFPKLMESLATKILKSPLEITVGGRSVVAPEIDQRVEVREADTKFTRLLEILGDLSQENPNEDVRSLIFVDRQEGADDLFRELLQRGYVCASLHGGKEQVDRDEAIKNFKNGDVPTIVATSVAARGLDVKELKLVVNYDAPNHLEDYVHRAGRTGRAGNTGRCITFITPDQDKFSVDIVRALEASNAFIPPELKEMSDKFLAKIKAGKAKAASSGFHGKGLERIERKREEKDRAEKVTYGDTSEAVSLSSREGAVIPYKPKTNEFKPPETSHKGDSDYTFTEIHIEIIDGPAPDRPTNPELWSSAGPGTAPSADKKSTSALPKQTLEALEKAKREGRSVDAERLAKVVQRLTDSIQLTKQEKFAAAIAVEAPRKGKDPDATNHHSIAPINDYPQKARWNVTSKEALVYLNEMSQASITMRGQYYPPGAEPPAGGEPKLYLLIESNDREKVVAAVDEIRRRLIEGSMSALESADRGGAAGGRYSV